MEKITELFHKPLVIAAVCFIVGLIVGLPILGWGLWPVEYYDAAPQNLRYDVKADYLRMAIDSYSVNNNQELAKDRFNKLGPDGLKILESMSTDPSIKPESYLAFSNVVLGTSVAVGTSMPTGMAPIATSIPSTSETATTGLMKILPIALGVSCVFMLIIGGILAYLLLVKNRKSPARTPFMQSIKQTAPTPIVEYESEGSEAPVARFMTTYTLGDDLYDDSFSIDAASGEFLGECGVGISHVLGTDEPKKVTAFEVWLFDKNDVQTVTKVLMSQFALSDAEIRQTLVAKGEPIAIDPGKIVHLETATLQLEARVVDMNYGQASLPANSYFDRITLELAVWQKET